ncbi:MAG: TIGR02466 family protein [Sneathiellaceae bacterium]
MQAPQAPLFARQDVVELFPTLVWAFDLAPALAAQCNAALLQQLQEITATRPPQKNDLSQQSDHDLHHRPCFQPLAPAIDQSVRAIMAHLQLEEAPFQVTGAWLNLSAPGIRHHEHAHPNNWLSLVYYVKTPKGGDTIRFYDPRPQAQVLMPKTRKLSPLTGSSITIAATAGRLLAFPSWFKHSVDANTGEGERVSLAINVMFQQFGERMAAPMWKPKLAHPGAPAGAPVAARPFTIPPVLKPPGGRR